MKFTYLITVFALLVGCSKKDPVVNILIVDTTSIAYRLKSAGINPSNPEQINYLTAVIDSGTYKLATGRKNNHAWLAKFSSTGGQTFSYELVQSESFNGTLLYPHFNQKSILIGEKGLFILQGWFTDNNDPGALNSKVFPIVVVVNSQTGVEISKLPLGNQARSSQLTRIKDFYFIEEYADPLLTPPTNGQLVGKYSKFYCIGATGKALWGRTTVDNQNSRNESERSAGLNVYADYSFANDSILLFTSGRVINNYYESTFRLINLKNYSLLFDRPKYDYPFTGDSIQSPNVAYKCESCGLLNKVFTLNYTESKSIKIIDKVDPIAGDTYHIENKLLGRYYYNLDLLSGTILNKGKY